MTKEKEVKKIDKKEKVVDKSGWATVAICYDFDKTLSPLNMQEYSFIPKIGMDKDAFWAQNTKFSIENNMDLILGYMFKMIAESSKVDVTCNSKITESDLNKLGKDIELFEGVETWFSQIEKLADTLEINVEHYIISAGIKEMIEGTSIVKRFKKIYASSFAFDKKCKYAIWPSQVVNSTNKTQFLFRINKGCLDELDGKGLNKSMEQEKRHIPFDRMIYIGDSETDIPCMTLVKRNGGYSIGVFNPNDNSKGNVYELINDGRINYFAPADYRKGKQLYCTLQLIFNKIHAEAELKNIEIKQKNEQKNYYQSLQFNGFAFETNLKKAISTNEKGLLQKLLNGKFEFDDEEIERLSLVKFAVLETFPCDWERIVRDTSKTENPELYRAAEMLVMHNND
ncbi:MAG: HAD family hydrolase [Clostridia bacterium]